MGKATRTMERPKQSHQEVVLSKCFCGQPKDPSEEACEQCSGNIVLNHEDDDYEAIDELAPKIDASEDEY